ncbi:hypothetical protein D0863_08726 [Hortaea werneckii]|uniref:Phosphotyrosine protein phosphatase I domain-containing protein n=1 Tax=Hortaea werneckii TaxID=91943 RepID=A0A3M7DNQ6_HORWE|nr:hypothetical protein D0863_08726 [Hortaea werneckii]
MPQRHHYSSPKFHTNSMAPTSADPAASAGRPVSVLFVCLGNICRSPMAEGVFRNVTHAGTPQQHPLIKEIDSCGTGAYHAGDSPDSRTMSVLADNGLTDYKHRARKLRTPEDFLGFDYILGMDQENVMDIRDEAKRAAKKGLVNQEEALAKVHLYGSFGGKSQKEQVQDPYYGARDGFTIAYDQLSRFSKGLVAHIEQEAARDLGKTTA